MHAAAGAAHSVLGSAGVGPSILALETKAGVRPSSPERQSVLPKVTQRASGSASPLYSAGFKWRLEEIKFIF